MRVRGGREGEREREREREGDWLSNIPCISAVQQQRRRKREREVTG